MQTLQELNQEYRRNAQRYVLGINTCEECKNKLRVEVYDDGYSNRDDEWTGCPYCGHKAYLRTAGNVRTFKIDDI